MGPHGPQGPQGPQGPGPLPQLLPPAKAGSLWRKLRCVMKWLSSQAENLPKTDQSDPITINHLPHNKVQQSPIQSPSTPGIGGDIGLPGPPLPTAQGGGGTTAGGTAAPALLMILDAGPLGPAGAPWMSLARNIGARSPPQPKRDWRGGFSWWPPATSVPEKRSGTHCLSKATWKLMKLLHSYPSVFEM